MRNKCAIIVLVTLLLISNRVSADDAVSSAGRFIGPQGQTAISLSYDDSLNSQLDNAVPELDKHNLKASFYVVPSSESFVTRLEEWRALAKRGHELGNHTVYHSCRGSLPGRNWVEPENDLDKKSAQTLMAEVIVANTLLQALDGRTERTFTAPCGDTLAAGEDYINSIRSHFVAIKGQGDENNIDTLSVTPGMSGEELISYVENKTGDHQLINIVFHGVGGDYLAVSQKAHSQFLAYLAGKPDIYRVDSYINIVKRVDN